MPRDSIPSALTTVQEWEVLERELFQGGGAALTAVYERAHALGLAPAGFLSAVLLRVVALTPPEVTFDAGLGRGSLNMFLGLVGPSGLGKDRTMRAAADAVRVSFNGREIQAFGAEFGSGEGLVEALADSENRGVVANAGELSTLHARMHRQGSTLRGTLLNAYSGNDLTVATRQTRTVVERDSYRCVLWAGCQPDLAGLILDGNDDGYRHRWLWIDIRNPLMPESPATGPIAEIPVIELSPKICEGHPVTFPQSVREETWRKLRDFQTGAIDGSYSGHRQQTAQKIAVAFCLLRSGDAVSMDDWRRAGVLMRFSDKVLAWLIERSKDQKITEVADSLERAEQAREEVAARRTDRDTRKRVRLEAGILQRVQDNEDGQPPLTVTGVVGWVPGRDRPRANAILERLAREQVLVLRSGNNGGNFVERGSRFHEYWQTLDGSDSV